MGGSVCQLRRSSYGRCHCDCWAYEYQRTSVSRQNDCKKMQMELKTGTVQPLMRAYTDGESNGELGMGL